jgi:insulysin
MLAAASASPLAAHAVQTTVKEQAIPLEDLSTPDFTAIVKPPLDDREYVSYTLGNGLRVLLCSDPSSSSSEAAAAMDVHVGSMSDPDDVPGIAHFNEHMLFLGTKRYPKEDSFESFLATNGGISNAYTDNTDTVYFFTFGAADADNKLAECLNRFGSFFTEPLFTESATGRELNAIESENAKNLQSDIFRTFQIAKSRANPNHPFQKFSTGNKKTLLDMPQEKGLDLRQELINFYNSYYSANQMTLAIVAPQSIDTLKGMVKEAFSDIPNRNVEKPESAWAGVPPFGSANSIIPSFEHVVEIVPVSDLRQVQVTWPLVYQTDDDRYASLLIKPSQYVAHLLGHEGPRSLLSYLKRKGWANSLTAATNEELTDFEIFEVIVGLTTQGLAAVDSVVEAIYSYISLLRDRTIPDYVFKEVLQLAELQWRFLTKGNIGPYATSIATAMQKFPPALYVAGPRRLAMDEVANDPQISSLPRSSFPSPQQLDRTRSQVEKFVSAMMVENAMVTILSKTFEGRTDRKERWYGTDYNVRPIPDSILNRWKNCEQPKKLNMNFPKPNPFIPSEAGLRVKYMPAVTADKMRRKSFEERMIPITPPRIIRDDGPDGRWTVYFKQDDRFGKPKGFVVFQILTKGVFSSPMSAALADLYEICVADRLDEYAYDGT